MGEEGKQRMSTSILNVHNNPVNFAFLYLTKTAKTLLFSNFFYICYIHSKTRSLLHAEIILADFCVKLKYVLFVPRTLRTVGKHGNIDPWYLLPCLLQ